MNVHLNLFSSPPQSLQARLTPRPGTAEEAQGQVKSIIGPGHGQYLGIHLLTLERRRDQSFRGSMGRVFGSYLVVHPTNRVGGLVHPTFFTGISRINPLPTGVITHLRFVG